MLSNEKWFGASAGFYPETIDQSLRFEDGDTVDLYKNFSASNRRTNTYSFWIKRANLGSSQIILSGGVGTSINDFWFHFEAGDILTFRNITSNVYTAIVSTTRVFRDTTNWYHIVLAVDTTQSTASDRIKIYVNGVQETLTFSTTPAQDSDLAINFAGNFYIGRLSYTATQWLDGYMAEINFIDGTALTPSSFGETKNDVWIPKAISGLTYGTNGFRLTFADSSSIGDDTSGNGNDFTATSGLASTDVVLDSPTNNFSTLNVLDKSGGTISEGNLRYDTSVWDMATGTFLLPSGKWYYEVRVDESPSGKAFSVGIIEASRRRLSGNSYYWSASGWSTSSQGYLYGVNVNGTTEYKISAGSAVSITSHPDIVQNSVIGIFIDLESSTTSIKYNVDGGTPFELFTGMQDTDYVIGTSNYQTQLTFNFGQDSTFAGQETAGGNTDANGKGDFHTALPSSHTDYLALCSSNLPDTTISPNQSEQADDHFNTVLYTGNGTDDREVTGVGFRPDWGWFKERNNAVSHLLFDSSRGASEQLKSDSTSAESTQANKQKTFTNDGYTLGTDGQINGSSDTYVVWNWKAGGTTPTKTYKVKVVADSTDYGHGTGANKYQFFKSDGTTGFGTNGVDLDLQEGGTYVFDWSDSSAQGHPLRFSLTNNGTHGGGSEYTTGVVKDDSNYLTTITVASGVANLYYYCQLHSGMGAEVRTNTTHGSTNFDGSILSVSQTNETSGFSIVTYTGTGSNGTIGHGLGKVPKWILIKERNGTRNWIVYHGENTSAPETEYLHINQNLATQDSAVFWNDTAPTSSVISLGTGGAVNFSGNNYVAFVFAEIEGYSKFGSYQPNGSTDGTYIHLGFSPSFFMAKSITASGYEWVIIDNKRTPFNEIKGYLVANEPSSESTSYNFVDFLSNGIKIRASSGNDVNASGHTVIYMAFADQPFKFSNAK